MHTYIYLTYIYIPIVFLHLTIGDYMYIHTLTAFFYVCPNNKRFLGYYFQYLYFY